MGAPSSRSAADLPTRPGGLAAFDTLRSDTLAVFWPLGARPLAGAAGYLDWRMCGALSRAMEGGVFTGEPGEVMLIPTEGRLGKRRVFVFGVAASQASADPWDATCRAACDVLLKAGARVVSVVAPWGPRPDSEAAFLSSFGPAARASGLKVPEILVNPDS